MLAWIQFAAPALLAGSLLAALPLIVHLLLRPRPRRVVFPAVSFLRAALASGQRAQRLRNLWLLLARMLLLACAAVLLAGPTCSPLGSTAQANGPVACVIVMDDSWSMLYRAEGDVTLLDRARESAVDLVRAAADWPQPSVFAVVWADPAKPPGELTEKRSDVLALLRQVPAETPHACALGQALRRGAGLLQAARQPDRRLVVFTDQAAHAWRDVPPGALAGIENLSVTVHSVAPEQSTNVAIINAGGPRGRHSATSSVPVLAVLQSIGVDAACTLVIREKGHVLDRLGPLALRAGHARDVSIMLPPHQSGAHAVTLAVEPSDRLAFDQRRYLAFQTAPRLRAWLVVSDSDDSDSDLTALLLRNLLAPETLSPERQAVSLRVVSPAELAELGRGAGSIRASRARDVELVIVIGGVELSDDAQRAARHCAERGAAVVLIPGSRDGACDWPGLRRLLARVAGQPQTLESVTSFSWESASAFAGVSDELDELTQLAVRRRVRPAGLEDGVVVEARYADGAPAMLSLRRGRGRIMLLTTSPDPEWSELGVRAAGLLTWMHVLMREALGPPDSVAMFTVGERSRRSFANLPDRGVVRVEPVLDSGVSSTTVHLVDAEPSEGWPTTRPGIYAVRTGRKEGGDILYAVNWPPEESDLAPIDSDRLSSLLGAGDVRLKRDRGGIGGVGVSWWLRLVRMGDPARVLPLILLALLVVETFAANRRR